MYDLSNPVIENDLEWPLKVISRANTAKNISVFVTFECLFKIIHSQ